MRYTVDILSRVHNKDCPHCGSPIDLVRITYLKDHKSVYYYRCDDREKCKAVAKATMIGNNFELLEELADRELYALRSEIMNIVFSVTVDSNMYNRMAKKKLYNKEIMLAHLAYSFPHWPSISNLRKLAKNEAKELYRNLKNYYGPFIIYSERNLYYRDKYFIDHNLIK